MPNSALHPENHMKRLLIVTTVPETLATILKGQPRHLSGCFDVQLASGAADSSRQVEQLEGIKIHVVPMVRGIQLLTDLRSVLRMVQLIRALQPDAVHSYTPKAGLITMLAGWFCRVPVRVHTFTGLIFPTAHGLMQKLLIWVDRLICACATKVVPEGEGVKRDLVAFGITQKPLQVIGYGNIAGVDTSWFSPSLSATVIAAKDLRARLGISQDAFVFCFVGRLNRDKGVKELMHAFSSLPPSSHLLIVGSEDPSAPVEESVLAALRSHTRVHELGFSHDIRPALQASNVLTLPSYREGFPNVVLQAGAMGLPVIATDINGCNEVIEPGFNGWLVEPRNVDSLHKAMLEAFRSSTETLEGMGHRARERIKQRFEQQQHWVSMVAFYKRLLNVQRFLLVGSLAESLINFRGPLIAALQAGGVHVHVAAPDMPQVNPIREQLQAWGVDVHSIILHRTGMNPVVDLQTLWCLWRLMRRIRPEYVLSYTVKPVIYGSLAAALAGVPRCFALITGLGYAFQQQIKGGLLQYLVQRLYVIALSKNQGIFFQNPDDQKLFRQQGLVVSSTHTCVVNGSGVDIARFSVQPFPEGPTNFLLIARLLGDKGVREFVGAACKVKAVHPQVQFTMVGWIDSNPDAIQQHELDDWVNSGVIHFMGRLSDVRPVIAACSVYVLPSYREGTPRTVLEAMAMGRAIITTDAPGCRETVVDGDNGLLVSVKSVDALAQAMCRFIDEPNLAVAMGMRSRLIAEDKYDVNKVNAVMLSEMGLV